MMKNDSDIETHEKTTIILNGSLTIQKIGELKDTFSESLSKDTEIVIDHSAAEAFDFSYLQLFYSVYTTLKDKKINLSIIPDNTLLFEKLYKEAGFDFTALAAILPMSKEVIKGKYE
jgi:hypothetical protein